MESEGEAGKTRLPKYRCSFHFYLYKKQEEQKKRKKASTRKKGRGTEGGGGDGLVANGVCFFCVAFFGLGGGMKKVFLQRCFFNFPLHNRHHI
jgi:hypothetical protein